jgi:hypothetical protein
MCVLGLVITASAALSSSAALDSSATLIVMPARTRVIQLAFQVARVKDVGLVAYNNSPTLKAPLVHVWNGREWIQIGMDEYTAGSFMPSRIGHVFILGDSTELPAAMTVDPAWAATVHKTADLGISSLLNQFNEVLQFSGPQWRWLAGQNGLKLHDGNAERRRFGRWGRQNVDATIKPGIMPAGEMPPEPPVRDIKEPVLSTVPVIPPVVETPKVPETTTAPVPVPAAEMKSEVKPVEVQHLTIPVAEPSEPKPAEAAAAPAAVVPATNAPAAADAPAK